LSWAWEVTLVFKVNRTLETAMKTSQTDGKKTSTFTANRHCNEFRLVCLAS
jgi:hypothetical protein